MTSKEQLEKIYTIVYTSNVGRCITMMNAKLFKNGQSQAVRLPKEYRFEGDEVLVNKIGDVVLLMPKESKWSGFLSALDLFSDDFMSEGRNQPIDQKREKL